MTKTTKIYLLICIAVLLYGLFGCKQKEKKEVEFPQGYIPNLDVILDSMEKDSNTIYHMGAAYTSNGIDTLKSKWTDVDWNKTTRGKENWHNPTVRIPNTNIDTSQPDQGIFALWADTTGNLFFPDTSAGSLFSFSDIRVAQLSDMTMEEVAFYFEGEKVAYRKKDSAWVFINPDKTIQILDSLYKRCK